MREKYLPDKLVPTLEPATPSNNANLHVFRKATQELIKQLCEIEIRGLREAI